jgi:protein N-lysine methyltransferase METTL21A
MPASVGRSPSSSPPLDPVALSEDLAPLPNLKTKGNTDITFDGQLSHPLKLHEDVRTGCGGQTWPAGMVLGKHLLRYHRDELQTARMLVFLPTIPCSGRAR